MERNFRNGKGFPPHPMRSCTNTGLAPGLSIQIAAATSSMRGQSTASARSDRAMSHALRRIPYILLGRANCSRSIIGHPPRSSPDSARSGCTCMAFSFVDDVRPHPLKAGAPLSPCRQTSCPSRRTAPDGSLPFWACSRLPSEKDLLIVLYSFRAAESSPERAKSAGMPPAASESKKQRPAGSSPGNAALWLCYSLSASAMMPSM